MAIRRDAPVQQLDAAVEAAVEEGDELRERRVRATGMTPGQRRKAQKDKKRNRAMFDLPEGLERLLDQIAEELSVPRSQVATYLMVIGAQNVTMEELEEARRSSRSMKYEFVLEQRAIPWNLKRSEKQRLR